MLAYVGGDVRALQQILAAPHISPTSDTAGSLVVRASAQLRAVLARRDTLKIIPTPDAVRSVAFTPDGTRLATASDDKHGAGVGPRHRPPVRHH